MDEGRAPGTGARPRSRKPTPAERRDERGAVDDVATVLDAAARFLEARSRSEAEVRQKLARLGYRSELIEEAIGRLHTLHYLDDEAFARSWVESRDRSRPRGEHALRLELGRKGVDRETVDAVIEERRDAAATFAEAAGDLVPDNADEAAAERLLDRKRAALSREPDYRRRMQKAYAMLARNGFSPGVCSLVARRVVASLGGSDDGDAGQAPGRDD